jgi:hypothetical protein
LWYYHHFSVNKTKVLKEVTGSKTGNMQMCLRYLAILNGATSRVTLISLASIRPLFPFPTRAKEIIQAGHRCLTPIILATQEAEIRRIEVQSQPTQIVHNNLSQKNSSQKIKGWNSGPKCRP